MKSELRNERGKYDPSPAYKLVPKPAFAAL
jgi:hypothetical protein